MLSSQLTEHFRGRVWVVGVLYRLARQPQNSEQLQRRLKLSTILSSKHLCAWSLRLVVAMPLGYLWGRFFPKIFLLLYILASVVFIVCLWHVTDKLARYVEACLFRRH